jgi:hypothetical protein
MSDRNPFGECVYYITGVEFLPDVDYGVEFDTRVSSKSTWFDPFNIVLDNNGLSTMFFSFENDVLRVDESMNIADYTFDVLPNGKCVLLGIDEMGMFKCVAAGMIGGKLGIIYDPTPDHPLVQIYEIGFFINTYMAEVNA